MEYGIEKRGRLNYLDAARGIAIICVIIGHMNLRNRLISQYIYSFHMPIFFIISGMLFAYGETWRMRSLRDNIKRKALNLLYPYVMYSILSIIVIALEAARHGSLRNFLTKVSIAGVNTLKLDGIQTLWFLPALFIAEAVFLILHKLVRNKKSACMFTLGVAFVTTIYAVFTHICDKNGARMIPLTTGFNILNRALIGFIFLFIGYLTERSKGLYQVEKHKLLITALILSCINFFLFKYNFVDLRNSVIGNPVIYYINAICGSYSIIILSKLFFFKNRLFVFFGKNSLIIFATHLNFMIIGFSLMLAGCFTIKYEGLVGVIIVIAIESVVVLLSNRFFGFVSTYTSRGEVDRKLMIE